VRDVLASVEGGSGAGEKAALIALALLTASAVLLRPRAPQDRLRAALMVAVVALTPALLAIDVWDSSPIRHLRAHPALAAAAILAGLAAIAGLATLFARRPAALPLAAVFTLPFRVPISSAGTTANLLVPLYAVVAAGVLAQHLPRLLAARGTAGAADAAGEPTDAAGEPTDAAGEPTDAAGEPAARGEEPSSCARLGRPDAGARPRLSTLASPRTLESLLVASIVLYAVQAAYSAGFSKALQNVAFFYVPFALLLTLLREARWTRTLLLRCAFVAVALAVLFAGIGFVEYASRSLLLNSKLVAANVYGNYFRVNSLFYDPNIYGRYLALAMLLLATAVLCVAERRRLLLCAAALAWLWAGLLVSISQTSIVSLLAGLVVLAGWRWGARRAAYVAGALALAGALLLVAAPSSLHFGLSGRGGSVDSATSGRANLLRGGVDLFAKRPLAGFGSGSFAQEYRAHQAATVASSTSASHTTPITVAAEQGVLGLGLYLALVLCCLGMLFAAPGRSPPWPQPGHDRLRPDPFRPKPVDARLWRASPFRPKPGDTRLRRESPFRPTLAACFVALLLHTMAYADFLEDPITWTLLGIGIALARHGACGAREDAALVEKEILAAPAV
jgi:O-antigen ligase